MNKKSLLNGVKRIVKHTGENFIKIYSKYNIYNKEI